MNMTNHTACEDTLSLVQQQRDQAIARADKAEGERDKARARERLAFDVARQREGERQEVADELYRLRVESRPLTPDAITDEMVERSFKRLAQMDNDGISLRSTWAARQVLEAALIEPPARPEGAEEIERLIETSPWHLAGSCAAEADWLAKRGVRVVAKEMNR